MSSEVTTFGINKISTEEGNLFIEGSGKTGFFSSVYFRIAKINAGTLISITSRHKEDTFVISKGEISSIAVSNVRMAWLLNIAIITFLIAIAGITFMGGDLILIFLASLLFYVMYLLIRTTAIEIETSGGRNLVFSISGDLEKLGRFCSLLLLEDKMVD